MVNMLAAIAAGMNAARKRRLAGIAKILLVIPVFGKIGGGVEPADRDAGNGGEPRLPMLVKIDAAGRADRLFRKLFQRRRQRLLCPGLLALRGTPPLEYIGRRVLRDLRTSVAYSPPCSPRSIPDARSTDDREGRCPEQATKVMLRSAHEMEPRIYTELVEDGMVIETAFYRDLAYVFGAAVVGGSIAKGLRQPLILGYLLGGILIGPFTPGPTVSAIHQFEVLAEIGVILLMYSIGLEFSFRELLQVKWVAIVGGPVGIVLSIGLALLLSRVIGWGWTEAVAIGATVSVASTMVLSRTLMDRGELLSPHGRIMVGITLVEDLAVVVLTVLLPSLAEHHRKSSPAGNCPRQSFAGPGSGRLCRRQTGSSVDEARLARRK